LKESYASLQPLWKTQHCFVAHLPLARGQPRIKARLRDER
jgi:hypothetical protein